MRNVRRAKIKRSLALKQFSRYEMSINTLPIKHHNVGTKGFLARVGSVLRLGRVLRRMSNHLRENQ